MIKRPFLFFMLVIGFWVSALLWFLQSPQFAVVLKTVATRYIPTDIGIQANFSEFSVKLFPPGFSVKNPEVKIEKNNVLHLPPGSSIKAEKIDFTFLPLQVFSGDIRVHEVGIVNGEVKLILDPETFKKKPDVNISHSFSLHWDELFQVHAESVTLQNVRISVQMNEANLETTVKNFKLAQWSGRGGLGYSIYLNSKRLQGDMLRRFFIPEPIESIEAEGRLNALGFQLASLRIDYPQTKLLLSGQVNGNLLTAKELKAEAKVDIDGELGSIYSLIQKSEFLGVAGKSHPPSPKGHVTFRGKVNGNLLKWMETSSVEGDIKVQDCSFQNWVADSVSAEARWEGTPSGGEITLNRAMVLSKEIDREGSRRPGSGGRVEIGTVRWKVGSTQPIALPIQFERAHIHWLAAPVLEQVYPLDFRLSGEIGLNIFPPTVEKGWEAQGKLNSSLDQFRLDNQKYLQPRPLSTVFSIPKINLDGTFSIDSKSFRPQNIFLSLPRTKLKVNGKIDFKTGYDLFAVGSSNVEDLGKIAENRIHGQGNLSVHVHGPASRVLVDVDADLKAVSYLNLAFGDVKGRITWDDSPSTLIFEQMKASQGVTPYWVDGKLVLGKKDRVDLDVQIPNGNIKDFIHIFDFLVRPLGWFPHTLNGPFSGALKVEGGISLDQLKVLGAFEGSNWEYLGERFKVFKMSGGYDGGSYLVNSFSAIKRSGTVEGRISYAPDKRWDWALSSHSFNMSDFDHIVRLDVPVRGKLRFASQGKGIEGALESYSEVELTDFSVRGTPMASSHLSIDTKKGTIHVLGSAMEGQGLLDVNYDSNPKGISSFLLNLKQLDFSPILLLFNPKSIQDKALAGTGSGELSLSFHAGKIERANGSLAITDYDLARTGSQFNLVHPVVSKISDGTFEIKDLAVRGKSGEASLSVKSKQGELQGKITGDVDTSILEFLSSTITQGQGTAALDFSINGTIKNPIFAGTTEVRMDTLRLASFDSPIENFFADLKFHQNLLTVRRVEGDLGGGDLTMTGNLTLYPDRFPAIALKGKLNNSRVKIFPFQFAKVSGVLGVSGNETPYTIDGKLEINSALTREKVLNQKQTANGLKALIYAPPARKQNETNASKFKLNIGVDAPSGIQIQNDLFRDAEAKGHLTIVNTLDAPRVLGTVQLIQGKLLFKDHVFQIQSAAANFDNPTVTNPRFDLNANTELNDIKIQLFVTGRLDKMKVELSSNPSMQESDILSLLTLGMTAGDAKKLSSTDLSAVQQGEAASLVLHSLDFNRDLEDRTGFQVQVDELTNTQQGVSAFRPVSQSDSSAAPQITIRRKLSDRLSLSAGRTVGAGSLQTNQVNLDYSVNSNVSVTGVFSNYGTNGSADAQTNQNSLGLDLKFQRRFK